MPLSYVFISRVKLKLIQFYRNRAPVNFVDIVIRNIIATVGVLNNNKIKIFVKCLTLRDFKLYSFRQNHKTHHTERKKNKKKRIAIALYLRHRHVVVFILDVCRRKKKNDF